MDELDLPAMYQMLCDLQEVTRKDTATQRSLKAEITTLKTLVLNATHCNNELRASIAESEAELKRLQLLEASRVAELDVAKDACSRLRSQRLMALDEEAHAFQRAVDQWEEMSTRATALFQEQASSPPMSSSSQLRPVAVLQATEHSSKFSIRRDAATRRTMVRFQ